MQKHIGKALCLVFSLWVPLVAALGLGSITVESALNEPLRATVPVQNPGSVAVGELRVGLADPADYEMVGIKVTDSDYTALRRDLNFSIKSDAANRPAAIAVSSRSPVREPYINFLLRLGWPDGRILKEFTVFLDPVAPLSRTTGDNGSSAVTVLKKDTLWAIASRVRPVGVSVHQTMHAIKAANPDAFAANNINQLKAGYLLQIPSQQQITSLGAEQALNATQRDAALWVEEQPAPASPAPQQAAPAREGELRLAAAGQADAAAVASEQLDSLASENRELSRRVELLEAQVADLKRLLTLKNNQLALLQQLASETAASDPAPAPATTPQAPTTSEQQLWQLLLSYALPADKPLWLQPLWLLLALAVVLLLLLWVIVAYRRARAQPDTVTSEPEASPADPQDLSDYEALFASQPFEVAASKLNEQIEAQAHRGDLRLLMLRKAAEHGHQELFVEHFRSLEAVGKSEDVDAARRLLVNIRGDETWLAGTEDLIDDLETLLATAAADEAAPDQNAEAFDLEDFALDEEDEAEQEFESPPGLQPEPETTADPQTQSSDENRALAPDDEQETSEAMAVETGDAAATNPQTQSSDENRVLAPDDEQETSEAMAVEAGDAAATKPQAQSSDENWVLAPDDEQETSEAVAVEAGDAAATKPQAQSSDENWVLAPDDEQETSEAVAPDSGDATATKPQAQTSNDDWVLEMGDDQETGEAAAETGDAATRLELAEAFIEMGYAEGAIEVLKEVLEQGDAAQQTAARELLEQIG